MLYISTQLGTGEFEGLKKTRPKHAKINIRNESKLRKSNLNKFIHLYIVKEKNYVGLKTNGKQVNKG